MNIVKHSRRTFITHADIGYLNLQNKYKIFHSVETQDFASACCKKETQDFASAYCKKRRKVLRLLAAKKRYKILHLLRSHQILLRFDEAPYVSLLLSALLRLLRRPLQRGIIRLCVFYYYEK